MSQPTGTTAVGAGAMGLAVADELAWRGDQVSPFERDDRISGTAELARSARPA